MKAALKALIDLGISSDSYSRHGDCVTRIINNGDFQVRLPWVVSEIIVAVNIAIHNSSEAVLKVSFVVAAHVQGLCFIAYHL